MHTVPRRCLVDRKAKAPSLATHWKVASSCLLADTAMGSRTATGSHRVTAVHIEEVRRRKLVQSNKALPLVQQAASLSKVSVELAGSTTCKAAEP